MTDSLPPLAPVHDGQFRKALTDKFGAENITWAKTRGDAIDGDKLLTTDTVADGNLKAYIERIERLEEEKAGIAGDIKEVYAEAKGNGFDAKAMRKIVALRRMDAAERAEQEALLELYRQALGME